ncbi:MAG: LPXTG cell wall anchor domain-containing protein, partial [Actinobacteria bacterium]|nr:LPXTG cell wall anchor domain-containing protein [Actinomycetota bacterium]
TIPQIPQTGSDTNSQLTIAACIVAAGLAFLLTTRRRRPYYLVLPPL